MNALDRLDAAVEAGARRLVADRGAVVVALTALVFSGVIWRAGFTVTDSYTVTSTLAALSHGHLAVYPGDVPYGPATADTPGMHVVDGWLYGRNYGQAALALPVLVALRALGAVFDLRVLFTGAWCLCLLGLAAAAGDLLERPRAGTLVGVSLAALAGVANLAAATSFDRHWLVLVALQSVSVAAGAAIAVLLYRLLSHAANRRVGLATGLAAALATPVALWSVIPKRHELIACFAVAALYCLYRSRTVDASTSTRYRAAAYASVALAAWVHGGDAFLVLAALAAVDLPTAPTNSPRALATIGAVFLVALLPFLLTNALISGNPLVPPRLLPQFAGHTPASWQHAAGQSNAGHAAQPTTTGSGGQTTTRTTSTQTAGTARTTGAAQSTTSGTSGTTRESHATTPAKASRSTTASAGPPLTARLLAALDALLGPLGTLWGKFSTFAGRSLDAATDPSRVLAVFVRSGLYAGLPSWNDIAVDLAVLESMPLLGALAAVPVLAVRRLPGLVRRVRERDVALSPERTADAFAVCLAVLVVLVYLQRLPLHYQLTMRYLHPLYPLGLYGVARLPGVRRAVTDATRTLAVAFAVAVVVGVAAYAASFGALDLVQGEAVQLYAHVALATAGALAAWAVLDAVVDRRDRRTSRVGAGLLATAAGVAATYYLLAGVELFAKTDAFLLPLARVVSDHLHLIAP